MGELPQMAPVNESRPGPPSVTLRDICSCDPGRRDELRRERVLKNGSRAKRIEQVPFDIQARQRRDVGQMPQVEPAVPIIAIMKLIVQDQKEYLDRGGRRQGDCTLPADAAAMAL